MKNIFYLIKIVVIILIANNVLDAQVLVSSKSNNNTLLLNGIWKFKLHPSSKTEADSFFYDPRFDVREWASIKVPGHWEMQGFAEPKYRTDGSDATGLYRTEFLAPTAWKGNPVYIRFDGVLFSYSFWVNGNFIGNFGSAFNPCTFDISTFVKPGIKNVLAVRVAKQQSRDWEFDTFDCWTLSGIFRDVTLYSLPCVHFRDLAVKSYVQSNTATVSVTTIVEKVSSLKFPANVNVFARLTEPSGKLIKEFPLNTNSDSGQSDNIKYAGSIEVKNPLLWTAETPSLYTLELLLNDKQKIIERYTQRIGIREVSWANGVLKLNGIPIKLRGVNRHELSPVNGRAVSDTEMLQELKIAREANMNCFRTSHYPTSPRFVELCDSLGFYLINEIPFGGGDQHLDDETFLSELFIRAKATVDRDKNNPSVIVWSIGNENPFTPITYQTGKYVKRLDDTRPICYPQTPMYFDDNFSKSLPDSVDILAPHYPNVAVLKGYANKFNRPMILTEYAHAYGLDFGRMEEEWEIMVSNPKLSGGAVWHLFDQGILRKSSQKITPNAPTSNVWIDSVSYYDMGENRGTDGLVYANRVPQVDYWLARKVYSPVKPLGDTLKYNDISSILSFKLVNRYDFTNLSDISCKWQFFADTSLLNSGVCPLSCKPHDTIQVPIIIALPSNKKASYFYLKLTFSDKSNYQFNEKVYAVQYQQKVPELLQKITAKSSKVQIANGVITADNYKFEISSGEGKVKLLNKDGKTVIAEGPYARINRKPTMASHRMSVYKLTNSECIVNTINSNKINGNYKFSSGKPKSTVLSGEIEYTFSDSGYIAVSYRLSPDTTKAIALETGLSFLLPTSLTEFRWIGKGPYVSYPGKSLLNEFGFFHLTSSDIYYQGNHADIECAVFSDKNGNGFALITKKANIAVERTKEGILVSHNAFVSGRFDKGRLPDLTYSLETLKEISGSFIIVPLTNQWPVELEKLLGKSNQKVTPFIPFYSSYDQN